MFLSKCMFLFLGLLSVSHSAPLTCEELVQPLGQLDPGHLEGKWALIAGSVSQPPLVERFKQRDSGSINFSSNTSATRVSCTRSIRLDQKCHYHHITILLNGSHFTYEGTPASNLTGDFVRTSCSDCLIMRFQVDSGKRTHFYLFSRRREVAQTEMQEFQEQVRCLHMPPAAVKNPTEDLCPEETSQAQDKIQD